MDLLYLNRNNLAELPANTLADLTSLGALHLQGNSLTALEPTLFAPVKNTLTFLRLDDNRLTALPANVFSGLTNVTFLFLGENAFTTLPAGVFGDMTSLEALYLEEGALTTLPTGAFTGLTSLTTLYLNDNGLETLPSGAFTGLTSLTALHLYDNGLETLSSGVFTGLTSLTVLYLHNNALTTLPADAFTNLATLRTLYLDGNKFTTFPAALFDPLVVVQVLDLGDNKLATLPANIFDNLTGLIVLNLSGNGLTTLPAAAFDGPTGLRTLDLSDNNLTTLPAMLFGPIGINLSTLYLRANGFTSLSEGIFAGLTRLQDLDLSCNALTEFDLTDPTPFDPFAGSLQYLDLGANNFTIVPGESAVRAKLTALTTLYLTGAAPCSSPRNIDLSALTVSAGTLSPPFEEPGITSGYEVTVPHDVATITITPTLKDPDAVISEIQFSRLEAMDNDFTDGVDVALLYGPNDITLSVRSADRSTVRSYRVRVVREYAPATNARLRGLTLSDVTLAQEFDSRVFTYTADAGAVAATTVTPVLSDPDATAVIKLNGVADADGTVELAVGANTITVEVTAEDGAMTQTYTVIVTRAITAGVTVTPTSLTVGEGGSGTYTVVLDTQPSGEVTVTIVNPTDNADVTAEPAALTFTTANWNLAQTVTVSAAEDNDALEDTATVTHTVAGGDSGTITASSVAVTVTDNDMPGVTVTPTSLTVGEDGSGTYTVVLNTQPSGEVTVTIVNPTDNADVTAEPAALTFSTTDWATAQTVTVSADQDADMDDDTATVTHTVSGYGSVVTAASVTVTVTEDPTAPYDTDGSGAIGQSEASVALRDYLFGGTTTPFGGTTSQEVASKVLRRYLFGRN